MAADILLKGTFGSGRRLLVMSSNNVPRSLWDQELEIRKFYPTRRFYTFKRSRGQCSGLSVSSRWCTQGFCWSCWGTSRCVSPLRHPRRAPSFQFRWKRSGLSLSAQTSLFFQLVLVWRALPSLLSPLQMYVWGFLEMGTFWRQEQYLLMKSFVSKVSSNQEYWRALPCIYKYYSWK